MKHFIDLSSSPKEGQKYPRYYAVSFAVVSWLAETFGMELKTNLAHSLFSVDAAKSGIYVWLTPEQETLMRLKF